MMSLKSWSQAFERPGRRIDLLICLIGAVICVGLTGYFRIRTDLPASLEGDHLFFVTAAKSYINGHGFRLDSQLGFPGERDWLYFPSFDLSSRCLLWLAAHLTRNPFSVVHIYYVLGLAAMFGFAYWTMRRLGVRAWLAAIGSIASVMTPYLAARAYGHDTLAIYFSVPLGLGLALSIGLGRYDGSLRRLFTDPYVLVAIVVVATSGLYYAFYTVMLSLFGATAAAMARRRVSPVIAAVAVSVPIILLLVFSGFGLDLAQALSPQIAQPQRQPYEQILYGLNLATSSYPFRFWHKVAAGVAQSQASLPSVFDNEGVREWPGPFLTLVLLATPLILAACQLRPRNQADAEDSRVRVIALCSAMIVFAILFAARGGIGYLFNLMVSPAIRADARIMPFLTLAAIVVTCVGAELASASPRIWWRWGGLALAAVLLSASARPQLWVLYKFQRDTLAANQAERASVPAMLQAKDRAGLKAVLELPVVSWAEQPAIMNFQPYDHQLPYVYDRPRSPTRWSYGENEKQPWFPVVQYEAADPARVERGAQKLGFDGALIAKSAYDAAGLAKLQAGILAGGACRLYEDDHLALYALKGGRC
jgi:uncharacterized membrane protein